MKAADKFAYTRPHMSVKQRNSRIGKYIIDNLKFIIAILPPKRHNTPGNAVFVLNDANYARDRRKICFRRSYVAPSPCRRDAKKRPSAILAVPI